MHGEDASPHPMYESRRPGMSHGVFGGGFELWVSFDVDLVLWCA